MKINESDPKNKMPDLQHYYRECHWSTNYGHFVTLNSKDAWIVNQNQNFDYFCQNGYNGVYWTYDISDIEKPKPDVYIGMQIKDKNSDAILGTRYLNFSWDGGNKTLIEKQIIFKNNY
jgi:hypothetical protein